MKRESYEKNLIRQKIQAHREISRLEFESLKGNNPLASAFSLGAQVTSKLGGSSSLLKSTTLASIPAVLYAIFRLARRRSGRSGASRD